ncbi:MAG: hypothetical protein M3069_16360 [Chloroflexota bacterium]|nr:hypothetical protein [Chloroflexota bacterium]
MTAQDGGEIEQQMVLGNCAPGARRDQLRQSLGKDRARTPSVATEETSNSDVQHDAGVIPREVG